jgi:hypothetical protein
VRDDVAAREFGGRLGEDARDVERDIAVADHHDAGRVERRVQVGEIGVAIIPADEGGAADHAVQVGAGNVERPVVRRAGREDDRVVKFDQLVDRHIGSDRDMADEADIVGERDALVAARDGLDRLVIGRDPGADQAVGDGQAVDDVDRNVVRLLQCLCGIITRRARPDDCDMTHQPTPSGVRAGARPLSCYAGDASGEMR